MFDGGVDAFVAKVGATGALVWSSFLGGVSSDYGQGIAADGSGAFVTGYTYSTDFPHAGGFDTVVDGLGDAFLTKVDSGGSSVVFSTFLGGSSSDQGNAVAVDPGGSAHVVGYPTSSDFPTLGGFGTSFGGGADVFVTRFDVDGASVFWSSYLGAASADYGYGIAVGMDGSATVSGETYSTDFPVPNGYDTTHGGGSDALVTQVVACGNGVCDAGEDPCICAADCGADSCGNGCCGASENPCTCAADCPDACGDGCCAVSETACTCADDCGADTCGNGCCGAAESECNCPGECGDLCGDGCCTGSENPCICPADCPGAGSCGNGCQDPGETACNCPEDVADSCGDGCCTGVETACDCSCPGDGCPGTCGCGNGICEADEECGTCPADCGGCTDAGSDASGPVTPGTDGGAGAAGADGCSCAAGREPAESTRAALLPLLVIGLLATRALRIWKLRR
jgi:hypothetical protein